MEPDAKEGLAGRAGSALRWDHPQFYPVQCPRCNWAGMSNEAAGGSAIADTGDYNDIVCPRCVAPDGDYEAGIWVVLEEMQSPNSGMNNSQSYDSDRNPPAQSGGGAPS